MRAIVLALVLAALIQAAACNKTQDCPDLTIMGQPNCPEDTSWVCGCNDSTYVNECVARSQGMWVKSTGRCGE
ncbi:MAG: hypothetical protein HYZ16_07050 [Bacteroidetes bacterium]|nr:hypothetical protein [Bacteroidota bacterium]